MKYCVKLGNCLDELKNIPDESCRCCVTSPPYWGLRDYLEDEQLGMEDTPQEFVKNMVKVFREVKRILTPDGTFWLNIGDSYVSAPTGSRGKCTGKDQGFGEKHKHSGAALKRRDKRLKDLPEKNLIGVPWRLALALQDDGWILRQDIIWCLSGGNWVYVRTQKGHSLMMIRELERLKPETVQLWNGNKWTQLLGLSKTHRKSDEIEIILRSGERISCSLTHRFPTSRGLIEASEMQIGDILERVVLPEPMSPLSPIHISEDAMWLAGLYLAEGSRSGSAMQIAGHSKETKRWDRLKGIVADYGGKITRTVDGNKMDIRIYGKVLHSLIDHLISGKVARNKGVAPIVWKYSNKHIESLLDGYLSGDGHWDKNNNRWRLGFTRNYNLERDLRVICARLDYHLVLKPCYSSFNGDKYPSFRGEIRKKRSGHFNEKDTCEVVEIRKARCRYLYDIGVEDDPHVFALASGILTHNSKPNPMPESVKDRCTKSHEYVFLLTKQKRYYYDHEAIFEEAAFDGRKDTKLKGSQKYEDGEFLPGKNENTFHSQPHERWPNMKDGKRMRNKRSVWRMNTAQFKGSHFAVMPVELAQTCIKAGSEEGDWILDPFSGAATTGVAALGLERNYIGTELSPDFRDISLERLNDVDPIYSEEVEGIE